MTDDSLSIGFYELPGPSTRSRKELATLRRAGVTIGCVAPPRWSQRLEDWGLERIPARVGGGHRLRGDLERRIRTVDVSTSAGRRQQKLWQSVLDQPTPQIARRPADLNILAYEWVAAAEALSSWPAHIYWAADLDALPAVVWAAQSRPGSRVVYDAHELFMRLEYLDVGQLGDWEAIARDFIPQVDLTLTVCTGIADILAREYGARRVEVVANLAAPATGTRPRLRDMLGLRPDDPLAVHVGNVVPNRRPELAIHLLAREPRLHVAFVGEVRQDTDRMILDLARSHGVSDRLHIIDPVPLDELTSFLVGTDLSLILYSPRTSPNLLLAMPNKLYDSLAAGVAVVATEGTAAGDFVSRERVGRTFVDGSAEALAGAVRDLLDDNGLRTELAARREEFAWPTAEPFLVDRVTALGHSALETVIEPLPSGTAPTHGPAAPAPSWSRHPLVRGRKAAAWRLRRLSRWLEP